jgi:hypothetical protein
MSCPRPTQAQQRASVSEWNAAHEPGQVVLARGQRAVTRGSAKMFGASAVVPIVVDGDGLPRVELLTEIVHAGK